VGSVLKTREQLVSKILNFKAKEADIPEITRNYGENLEPEEFRNKVKKDAESLAKMVEFLNKSAEVTDIAAKSISSLSSSLNKYYGEVILKEEDLYSFSNKFDWLKLDDVDAKNREYLHQDFEFDFAISVSEFGRENLNTLINFLRTELKDDKAADFIQNLSNSDDIFAAINYLLKSHQPEQQTLNVSEFRRNADGSLLSTQDDEKFWTEYNAKREATYKELTDPDYAAPQFDYNSRYGYGFIGSEAWKTGDFNLDLGNFLRAQFLDKVNEVIRDNSAVQARFQDLASENFFSRQESIPDDYGLAAIPTFMNTHTNSVKDVMGSVTANSAERALNILKNFTYPELDDNIFQL
jgi:hypothetical protein